jgi:SpoVK/Ycf46/Vps4 family AAA+-type ATPase
MQEFILRAKKLVAEGRTDSAIASYETAKSLVDGSPELQLKMKELIQRRINELKTRKVQATVAAAESVSTSSTASNILTPPSEKPKVLWSDIVGLHDTKHALRTMLELPKLQPQLFANQKTGRCILLYGNPGTGKSLLAKAVASATDGAYFAVSSADLITQWQGESEHRIKALFDTAYTAERPVVFVDEIDSLARRRQDSEQEATRRIKTTLFLSLDHVLSNRDAIVMLATNTPWEIDEAFGRRITQHVYVPLPSEKDRYDWIKMNLMGEKAPVNEVKEHEMNWIATNTERYSGSDLNRWMKGAIDSCHNEVAKCITFARLSDGKYAVYDPIHHTEEPVELVYSELKDLPNGQGQLIPHPLQFRHLVKALDDYKATASQDDIDEFDNYAKCV